MPRAYDNRTAFRCSVAPENSAAQIKIGLRCYDASVIDTSFSGFCVRLPARIAKKVKDHRKQVLCYAGECWEVQARSRFADSDQYVHVGFTRVRDLTKLREPSSWGLFFADSKPQNDPAFLVILMAAFLIAALCLPGVGDHLGTAPKVRNAVNKVFSKFQ